MPYDLGPSKFNEFESDFDKINLIDNPTWEKKKPYSNNYWLVVPNHRHNIRLGNEKPYLTVFLRTHGEQFGDAITPLDFEDMSVSFKCFDSEGGIVTIGTADKTSIPGGEVQYKFTALDFQTKGTYYGEFEFITSVEGAASGSFTLPDTSQRITIIVS